MNETLETVLQFGALGLLAAFGYGGYRLATVYAPMVKDFLVGLIATQNAIAEKLGAVDVKVDNLGAAVSKLDAAAARHAENADRTIERARDDVLDAVKSTPRPSIPGGLPRPARAGA